MIMNYDEDNTLVYEPLKDLSNTKVLVTDQDLLAKAYGIVADEMERVAKLHFDGHGCNGRNDKYLHSYIDDLQLACDVRDGVYAASTFSKSYVDREIYWDVVMALHTMGVEFDV